MGRQIGSYSQPSADVLPHSTCFACCGNIRVCSAQGHWMQLPTNAKCRHAEGRRVATSKRCESQCPCSRGHNRFRRLAPLDSAGVDVDFLAESGS